MFSSSLFNSTSIGDETMQKEKYHSRRKKRKKRYNHKHSTKQRIESKIQCYSTRFSIRNVVFFLFLLLFFIRFLAGILDLCCPLLTFHLQNYVKKKKKIGMWNLFRTNQRYRGLFLPIQIF